MKKILGLLLVSSSIFSMQLALKMQTPRFDRVKSAVVKQQKAIVSQNNQVASHSVDTHKLHIDECSIRAPRHLSDIKLYHGKEGFTVLHNDKKHVIEKRFMDSIARNITKEELKSFLKLGYFAINQTNDGTFTLKAHERLVGGGPLFGAAMYWITKSLCYGTVGVAIGGTVITTGGAGVVLGSHLAAAGAGLAVASTAVAPAAIVTTAGVGVVSAATAGTVVGAGSVLTGAAITGATHIAAVTTAVGVTATQAAALTTAAGVVAVSGTGAAATIGTGAACVLAIESLSAAVGTFFGMLPTP